jgi:CRISPR-associated exonuclease Cas4
MNEQYYLPLAYLNAWEYCPRRFYLEYQLGENAENEHIILGRHLHRNVDSEGKHTVDDTVTYRHQWVWSELYLIHGINDFRLRY